MLETVVNGSDLILSQNPLPNKTLDTVANKSDVIYLEEN